MLTVIVLACADYEACSKAEEVRLISFVLMKKLYQGLISGLLQTLHLDKQQRIFFGSISIQR